METLKRETFTLQGGHAPPYEHCVATPDCIQEILSRVQNAHLAPFGQKAPSAVVAEVIGDVVNCCRNWQLMSDWLQSNSENQSSEDAPGLEEPADACHRPGPEVREPDKHQL